MDFHEKRDLIDNLQTGKETLIQAIDGLTEECAQRKPEAERWSILECMEHIAIAEEHMFGQITSASKTGTPMANKAREVLIRRRGADRARRLEAPDVARPKNCNTDLRAMTTTHPVAGPVNCYEMLLIMSAHPIRHAEQIREIRNI